MTTWRRSGPYWTETKKVIDGVVVQRTCCCDAPAETRRECADAAGNKTPCRCACHSDKGHTHTPRRRPDL